MKKLKQKEENCIEFEFPYKQLEDSTGFLMYQISNLWQRKTTEIFKEFNLTHVQVGLMSGIAWFQVKGEPVNQIRLAEHIRIDLAMTSQVLKKLEARNLVIRKVNPEDTRSKLLELTPEGFNLFKKTYMTAHNVKNELFGVLGKDLDKFNQMLRKLLEAADFHFDAD